MRKILSDIVDFSAVSTTYIEENFIRESIYDGTYSDVSNTEEVRIKERLKNENWRDVITDEFYENSNWLYQIIMDLGRPLFLEVLNLPKDAICLDVGSGWGQVSIPLARLGNVVALDLTLNRLDILKEISRQEAVGINLAQGNFLTFPFKKESFHLIIFNGSLEWIGIGRKDNESIRTVQIQALQKAAELLKYSGEIYIGIENSLGLKYLLGTPDDHTGLMYSSFISETDADELYRSVYNSSKLTAKTWSLNEYLGIISEAGLEVKKVYGCFPDYKLIRKMVELSDINEFIKKNTSLPFEHNGTDGTPVNKMKEIEALYKVLSNNGIAEFFCPSYGFILKRKG